MADTEQLTAATRDLATGMEAIHTVLAHLVEEVTALREEVAELRAVSGWPVGGSGGRQSSTRRATQR